MSEKKLVAIFVAAILMVGVIWYFADQKFKAVAPLAEADLEFNDGPRMADDDDAGPLALGDALPMLSGDWVAPDSSAMTAPETAGKVVLVDIWSTFCGPCVASIPNNNAFVKKYAPKGVVFVGAAPQPKGMLVDFKTKKDIQYPLLSTGEDTMKLFKIEYFPSMFLFGKDGKLIWQGSHILNKSNRLQSSFSKALKNALGSEPALEKKTSDASEIKVPAEFAKLMEIAKTTANEPVTSADDLSLKIGESIPPLAGDWIAPNNAAPEIKGKVLLIDFFTTQCATCIESLPYNNKIYERFAPEGFVFVNATPEEKALIAEFKLATPINYPVLTNCEELFKLCFVMEMPSTLLFNRAGKLIWKGSRVEDNGKLLPDFEKALTAALAAK